ncbi:hypothetical protein EVAR_25575_1 [Eumeta japonica]|uniref:Uncharacterized protein n=1 Tax=Eumeta variegata TaxID=151549 RepID=A0A4C1V0Q0_EUMVA|nr:hypothetical protein EVAR_25575_1 [Eumeta japonica]
MACRNRTDARTTTPRQIGLFIGHREVTSTDQRLSTADGGASGGGSVVHTVAQSGERRRECGSSGEYIVLEPKESSQNEYGVDTEILPVIQDLQERVNTPWELSKEN